MAKAPSFQWYPKDCDTDENVRAMDDREFGFYMRCLNHSWLNGGLPGNLPELARVLGRRLSYVEKVWPRVGRCFDLAGDRYFNRKQEEQRKTAREFVESRRNAAEIRWDSEKKSPGSEPISITTRHVEVKDRTAQVSDSTHSPGCTCIACAVHVQCSPSRGEGDADADAVSSHEVVPFVAPRKAHVLDEAFMAFMGEVALTETPLIEADYEDAFGEWRGMDMPERLLAIANFREKREAGSFADPAMVMRPARWLRRKEFNRRTVKARDSPVGIQAANQIDAWSRA